MSKLSPAILRVFHKADTIDPKFLIQIWKQELNIQGLSPAGIKFYLEHIITFINRYNIQCIQDFESIIKLKQAYYSLQTMNLSKQTLLHYHKSIKKYSSFLLESSIIKYVAIKDIPKPKLNKTLPKALSEEQANTLLEHILQETRCDSRSELLKMRGYIIVNILLQTGLRRQELLNLEWTHIVIHIKYLSHLKLYSLQKTK